MAEIEDDIAHARIEQSLDPPGTTLVSLDGELDLSSVPAIEAQLRSFLETAPDRIVFDMSGVTFMDSSGIAMLLRVAERVAYLGVRNPSGPVGLIIGATGLVDIFHVEP